jgi:hypothetical protein
MDIFTELFIFLLATIWLVWYSDLFRLQGGFLYGTEKFYDGIDLSYAINEDQKFATDLLNTLDYYVFLSFTQQNGESIKKRIVEICDKYLKIA